MTGWKSSAVGTANPTGAYYRLISQANLTASSIGSAIGQIESPGSAGLGQADRQAGRRSDRAALFKRTLKMKKLMTILVAALALALVAFTPDLASAGHGHGGGHGWHGGGGHWHGGGGH